MSDHEFVLLGVSLLHASVFMACSGVKGKGNGWEDEFLSAKKNAFLSFSGI